MCDNSRCSTYSWQLITTAGTWSDHFDRRRQTARGPFSLELTECRRSLLTLMTMERVQKWYLRSTSHCCEPHLEQFFFLRTVESLHPLLKFQLYAYCTSTSVGKGEFINEVSYSMELTVDNSLRTSFAAISWEFRQSISSSGSSKVDTDDYWWVNYKSSMTQTDVRVTTG